MKISSICLERSCYKQVEKRTEENTVTRIYPKMIIKVEVFVVIFYLSAF